MKCEKCGKDCDSLTARGPYNGNKDVGYYCEDCYEEQHDQEHD